MLEDVSEDAYDEDVCRERGRVWASRSRFASSAFFFSSAFCFM